jgi:hypothetical protein
MQWSLELLGEWPLARGDQGERRKANWLADLNWLM